MKCLIQSLAFLALAILPVEAGVSVSVHIGGYCGGSHYGGGYYGGSHGYSGGCFGGSHYCYGGYYGGYPIGYSSYGYAGYSQVYAAPVTYDDSEYYPQPYVSAPTPPPQPSPAPMPAPIPTVTPVTAPPAQVPAGSVDAAGYVHSPYTTTTFKVGNVTEGQTFHDPITGQLFQVHLNKSPQAPTPSGASLKGKLDEFGYVHSPYSTFTFKVQDGNYSQVFHDPLTGHAFLVTVGQAPVPAALATAKSAD